uniref:hypothetical protein n=1 Tax=Streptococcus sobrinus TaxID=1310 RepID=UPI0005174372
GQSWKLGRLRTVGKNNTLRKSKDPSLTHFAVLIEESRAFPILHLKRSPRPYELSTVRATAHKVGKIN